MHKLTAQQAQTARAAWKTASGTNEERQACIRAEVGLQLSDAELLIGMLDRAAEKLAPHEHHKAQADGCRGLALALKGYQVTQPPAPEAEAEREETPAIFEAPPKRAPKVRGKREPAPAPESAEEWEDAEPSSTEPPPAE